MFEAITKYSSKSFYELKLYKICLEGLSPKDLESFFVSWENQKLQRPLILIIMLHMKF